MIISKYNIICIVGPTASGKTTLASNLAIKIDAEIISADSRQVYKRMNLGTGKDYIDYQIDGYYVPSHLIDIVDPGYIYNLFEFQRDFIKAYNDIRFRNKNIILCGGSGLYIHCVIKPYKLVDVGADERLRTELYQKSENELIDILSVDHELLAKTDVKNKKRLIRAVEVAINSEKSHFVNKEFPILKPLIVGVKYDRATERERISERLRQRLQQGMIEEVKDLLNQGILPEILIGYGLEYKFITLYILGELTYEEMFLKLEIAIHQFAKRQMTWFRKIEREGHLINWLDGEIPLDEKINNILNLMKE